MLEVNDTAPAFQLPATGDQTLCLDDFNGRRLVLFFYPRDSTPGCTREGQDFRDQYEQFQALNTDILGVSRDSMRAHENFKAKQSFPFELLSDADEILCQAYDVIKDKKMYGREVRGIERSTFLIDEGGKLRAIWRKVKVPGHVDAVLEAVQSLS